MNYEIDRIEGDVAICIDNNNVRFDVPVDLLFNDAKEGDCFTEIDGVYQIDITETDRKRQANIALQNSLFGA